MFSVSAPGEASSRPTRLGRYELITRIGQGGMADVQLALQRGPAGFEKLVVVKLVHDALASQKAFVDMLLDEARVAALVKHPNVVDIYDLGQAGGRYFIAMEYLEGEPLLAVLRAGREGKRLDPLSTSRVIADTAEGLDAAHELRSMSGEAIELVHHDISLGNIVVLYNGQVKLVDFGVAKATHAAGPKTKVQGKFSYMAPEKLKGATGDRRSDLFSLGCVMWEALTLKRLFRGGNDSETMKQVLELSIQPPSKINGEVPPDFDPIVMRALDRDPARRQLTAKELAVEIEEVLRKRGYGAKNDRVARYMQDTFKTHIEARKKLVQEVVSKGSASAEVLDAAFRDPLFTNGSALTPTSSDFANPIVAPPVLPPPPASFADASRPPWDGMTATEISAPPMPEDMPGDATRIDDSPPVVRRFSDKLRDAADNAKDIAYTVARKTKRFAIAIANDRKKLMIIGGAGCAFLVIMIIAIVVGGGDGDAQTKDRVAAAPVTGSDTPDTGSAVVVAPGSAAQQAGSDEAIEPTGPEAGSAAGSAEHHRPHPPHVEKVDAEAMYKLGVQAYVKGDSKGALTYLQKARAAAPNHAPTWRVIGQVYEKLGDRGAAKNAFLRYLSLAPSAQDAPQIRQRVDHL